MNARRMQPGRLGTILLCAVGILLSPAMTSAADSGNRSDKQTRYLAERATCDHAQSREDRAACLREAGAAREEARRGRLDDSQASRYQDNALVRCKALPAADRQACEARIRGQGTTSGSVAGGGIYREYVVPAPPPDGAASGGDRGPGQSR